MLTEEEWSAVAHAVFVHEQNEVNWFGSAETLLKLETVKKLIEMARRYQDLYES